MNILVSGVAGDIGLGVGRILREWNWSGLLHGIDMQKHHAGHCVFDKCAEAPRATDSQYLPWLEKYIADNHIDIFLPTSEHEIRKITEAGVEKTWSVKILKSNDLTVLTSLDKHACLAFLAAKGIKVPEHGIVGVNSPTRYPVIIKPQSGQGSKGILRIDSEAEFNRLKNSQMVWQEYLLPEDEEYTCAVFRTPDVSMRIIALKRKLSGGLTGSGEVVDDPAIHEYVAAIAEALALEGVMNVQLRLTAAGPLLFEINPRLSSTLVFRDKMGYQDLRWWVAANTGATVPSYVPPKTGRRFYRGAQEYFVPEACN